MVFKFCNGLGCFFLLVDWKKLHVNVWGGIAACILQLIHDTEQDFLDNYHVYDAGIWILKSSIFFTAGVVFTMGIVFLQFIPQNKILKIVHVVVFSIGFLAFEHTVIKNEMLEYIHYDYLLSLADNLLVMSTLAWTKSFVLSIFKYMGRSSKKC